MKDFRQIQVWHKAHQMSYGSANEVDYLLRLSKDLSMLRPELYEKLNNSLIEVKKCSQLL